MRHQVALTAPVLAALLAACGGGTGSAGTGGDLAVTATDTTCVLASPTATAGPRTFAITNRGGSVTELYVYGPSGALLGEAENIGPGLTKKLTVELVPGRSVVACKPGGIGDGIRSALTVTAASAPRPTP